MTDQEKNLKPEVAMAAVSPAKALDSAKEGSEASVSTKAVTEPKAPATQPDTTKLEGPKVKRPSKLKEVAAHGQAHILATYNNTVVTLTDVKGNVIVWSTAGKCGFKGPKKSTAYAAGVVVREAVTKAMEMGLREVEVFVKGVGAGREAAVRALNANGLSVGSIKDVTPIPHNGPRPPKVRRV